MSAVLIQAVDLVKGCATPWDAAQQLAELAYEAWVDNDIRIDDITVQVLLLRIASQFATNCSFCVLFLREVSLKMISLRRSSSWMHAAQ